MEQKAQNGPIKVWTLDIQQRHNQSEMAIFLTNNDVTIMLYYACKLSPNEYWT